jgi:glycosyltransferase involved in cell wall biosynthesis
LRPKTTADACSGYSRATNKNQGKGGAIQTALKYANCELTVIHDADLEYHPRDLLRMIPLFTEQDADAVFGSRFLSADVKRVLLFRHGKRPRPVQQ